VAYPSALSDTGFKYQLVCSNGTLDIEVNAFFSPDGSWVKPGDKNAALLKHEQGHYNLAEVFALRLRNAIRHAHVNCADKANANEYGQKTVAQFQKDWQDAEHEYEENTRYGTDLTKQGQASDKIAADLKALNTNQR